MQIKHKLTGEVTEIDFEIWLEEYIPKKLDANYDILIKDTVFLREILDSGERRFIQERERNNAIKLVANYPNQFEFVEEYIKVGNTTFRFEATYNLEYDSFKLMFAEQLKDKLDDAYFLVTGKFPPSGHQNINQFVSNLERNKSARIFKLSIGPGEINDLTYMDLLDEQLATVHKSTKGLARSGKTQFQDFTDAKIGDYFYLCRGNKEVVLFGQFTENLFFTLKDGLIDWGLRKYRIIEKARKNNGYGGEKKWWTPNYNSTFTEIPKNEYTQFNNLIFSVFFEYDFSTIFNQNNDVEIDKIENNKKIISSIYSTSFNISEKVNGVIGVKEQATELAELLVNLNSEKGMMVGLFGRWGRGKTFFWNELKDYLQTVQSKPFIFAEFHAWKYQDTPASWAYLYESITKACIENSEYYKFLGIKIIKKNIFKLNLSKNGSFKLILFSVVFFISLVWFFFIPFNSKIAWAEKIIRLSISVGIVLITFIPAILFYTKHIPRAIDLFKKYSKVVSFKNLLGLQSEIQNELIEVLKASILNPKSQRLLLFVDDLDRCSEDRIIQIIDSLKVMLEDPEISARIVVLTAIDERILKRAIANKYYDSINKNFVEKSERKKAMETLVREYMDKLFISGIKLTTLSTQEKGEVFDAFSKNQDKVNYKAFVYDDNNEEIDDPEKIDKSHNLPSTFVRTNIEDIQKVMTSKDSINANHIEFEHADPDYEIEEFEYDYLKLMLKYHIDATPRSIRIYYYRYLLAKNFLVHQLPNGSSLSYVWNVFDEKKILPELIIYYSTEKNLDSLNERLKQLELIEDEYADLQLFEKYSFNRLLAIELFKVVEMVVAY